MQIADLPLIAYTALAINAFFAALLVVVRVARRGLPRRMLLQGLTMALMSVYWSLIAISSGPAPVIVRAEMTGALRLLAGVMAATWTIFWIVYVPHVVERRRP